MNEVVSSAQVTTAVCNAALRAALGNRGYSVSECGPILKAKKQGRKYEHILHILPVSRYLSDWDSAEDIKASASFAGVKKLLEDRGADAFSKLINTRDANFLVKEDSKSEEPMECADEKCLEQKISCCIAFSICLGTYNHVETTLVDLRAFCTSKAANPAFMIDESARLFHYIRAKSDINNSNGVIFRSHFQKRIPEQKNTPIKVTPETFTSSIKSTTAICAGVLQASLRQHGYDVVQNGSFLEASNGEHSLAILSVSRCLSDKKSVESTPVASSFSGVCKLLSRYGVPEPEAVVLGQRADDLEVIIGNADAPGLLCIAFCVCKYAYNDVEIAVVPVKTILQQAAYGNVFSIGMKSHDLFYDYTKANFENMKFAILQDCYIETKSTEG